MPHALTRVYRPRNHRNRPAGDRHSFTPAPRASRAGRYATGRPALPPRKRPRRTTALSETRLRSDSCPSITTGRTGVRRPRRCCSTGRPVVGPGLGRRSVPSLVLATCRLVRTRSEEQKNGAKDEHKNRHGRPHWDADHARNDGERARGTEHGAIGEDAGRRGVTAHDGYETTERELHGTGVYAADDAVPAAASATRRVRAAPSAKGWRRAPRSPVELQVVNLTPARSVAGVMPFRRPRLRNRLASPVECAWQAWVLRRKRR